jgi:hypothetical protein
MERKNIGGNRNRLKEKLLGMDFNKKYKGYLEWRLQYIQRQKKSDRDFDRHYFQSMDLEELIWFKENFIKKSEFVQVSLTLVVESIDAVITDKIEQRREER